MSARSPILDGTSVPGSFIPPGTQTAHKVLAGPATGADALPTFRLLVIADIPDLSAAYQPYDADLAAIALYATTAYGRALLQLTDGAAGLAAFGAVPTSRLVNTSSPLDGGGALTGDLTLSIGAASAINDGYLTRGDWNIFSGKVPGTRTVNGHALSGNIALSAADVGAEPALGNPAGNNYALTSTAAGVRTWNTYLNGFGAGDLSPLFTTSEALISGTAILTFALKAQNPAKVFAGPVTGFDDNPTFRYLVPSDIPDLSATYQPRSGVYTVATLPASPVQGDRAMVTDSFIDGFNSNVVGGGTEVVPVFYNGTQWKVG